MQIVQTDNPGVYELKDELELSIFVSIMFSVPLVFIGLVIMIIQFVDGQEYEWFMYPIGIFIGLMFIGGGVWVFKRKGVYIDMQQRAVVKWKGIRVPMKRKTYLIDNYKTLVLGTGITRGATRYWYPILMRGEGGVAEVDLGMEADRKESREMAYKLAKIMGLTYDRSRKKSEDDED